MVQLYKLHKYTWSISWTISSFSNSPKYVWFSSKNASTSKSMLSVMKRLLLKRRTFSQLNELRFYSSHWNSILWMNQKALETVTLNPFKIWHFGWNIFSLVFSHFHFQIPIWTLYIYRFEEVFHAHLQIYLGNHNLYSVNGLRWEYRADIGHRL